MSLERNSLACPIQRNDNMTFGEVTTVGKITFGDLTFGKMTFGEVLGNRNFNLLSNYWTSTTSI